MFRSDRRRHSVAVLGCLLVLFAAQAMFATHSWGGYHWARTANPFTLTVGDNLTAAWDPYLATTASDWSFSEVLNLTVVPGVSNPKNCKPALGRIEVCNSKYGNNGWLGIAQIWITGGVHITQGITKVNDTYFNTAAYSDPAWRNLVMCQEVGHAFGLDHQDEEFGNTNLDTCMDYTSNPQSNQHPNAHDYAELSEIYSHVDTFTTINQTSSRMPPAMTDIELEGPGQWGKLVAESARGRTSIYEADFGNGDKVVTHVIWVEGRERGKER